MLSRHVTAGTSIPAGRPAREAAEAALVENYPRLVRLAYLILPPSLGRHRRVLTAHALVQRTLSDATSLPGPWPGNGPAGAAAPGGPGREPGGSGPAPRSGPPLPGQRSAERPVASWLRATVVRTALRPRHPLRRPGPFLPLVLGLRLFPRAGGSDELSLDRALAGVGAEVRAAIALRALEQLPADAVLELLASAGVPEPEAAVRAADRLGAGTGTDVAALLSGGEFDPCIVHTRPTDLLRRRRHGRLAVLAGAAVLAAVVATAGLRTGPEARPEPVAASNALTATALVRAPAERWADTSRVDLTAWPPRGARTGDTALLRRALDSWSGRTDTGVRVTAARGTATAPPGEPPALLFAGTVDGSGVVLLHDGRRLARYSEAADGRSGASLQVTRADDSDVTTGAAVVLTRRDGRARFLLAPWIARAEVRDLRAPDAAAAPLAVTAEGVTAPVPYASGGGCERVPVLQLTSSKRIVEDHAFLLADLGELVPAHLTWTPAPGLDVRARSPREAAGPRGLAAWARSACSLPPLRLAGVRAVNRWEYAVQALPERAGTAVWVCSRADTWEGPGRTTIAFEPPGARPPQRVAALGDSAMCSRFGQHVLAATSWVSPSGTRYLLSAGSRHVGSITTRGSTTTTTRGPAQAVRSPKPVLVRVEGRLLDGSLLEGLVSGQPPGPGH
ncbi:hypothetical protein ACIRQY_12340 [Streptomyces sp. NPDC101490]|uniref:hypothetical protein n=1 Tax=Streptomyces sp. NPDC101490 TaxID=3366143 RepID=UPI00380849FF